MVLICRKVFRRLNSSQLPTHYSEVDKVVDKIWKISVEVIVGERRDPP